MNEILVYALDGCDRCKYAIERLDSLNIVYSCHVCEEVSDICDTLEEFTGCYNYPIVKISFETGKNVYLNSTRANKKSTKLSHADTLETFSSVDEMVGRLIELIKIK